MEKIKHIGIIGRLWWKPTGRHHLHSAEIFVNGERVAKIHGTGGDRQFENDAVEWLMRNGYLPTHDKEGRKLSPYVHVAAHELGFTYNTEAITVPRKKDL